MKIKILLLLSILIFCVLAASCDIGLEITSAKIDKYPDRIVYFAGADRELDLTGGEITLHTRDGNTQTYNMNDNKVIIIQNIDFNKPGIYIVELSGPLYFPIQIVDKEYIDSYMK